MGDVEAVRLLMQKRASADSSGSRGTSPLQLAAQRGHADLLAMLLCASHTSHCDKAHNHDASRAAAGALILATENGHASAVQVLLRTGVDPDIKLEEFNNQTAAAIASQRGYTDVVHELVRAGADLDSIAKAKMQRLARGSGRAT